MRFVVVVLCLDTIGSRCKSGGPSFSIKVIMPVPAMRLQTARIAFDARSADGRPISHGVRHLHTHSLCRFDHRVLRRFSFGKEVIIL